MRNVVSLMHMSLDGFVAGPKGEMDWIKFDEEVFSYVDTFIHEADTGLYGPKTFQMMESHWPKVLNDPNATGHQFKHARWYEKTTKIVFSRKLDKLDNHSARLVKENIPNEITSLKNSQGKNAMIFGSPGLVHSLTQLGLIDEFLIMLNPVILGTGIPMFEGIDPKINLRLEASTPFKAGVIGLHYINEKSLKQ